MERRKRRREKYSRAYFSALITKSENFASLGNFSSLSLFLFSSPLPLSRFATYGITGFINYVRSLNRTVIPNHSLGERREFGIFPGRCWGEMIGGKFRATLLWKAEGGRRRRKRREGEKKEAKPGEF